MTSKASAISSSGASGKLDRIGDEVSADSVEAYKSRRAADVERTRFRSAMAPSEVEQAAAAWAEAGPASRPLPAG